MIDITTINQLQSNYGSSFYIFDEAAYRQNLAELKMAFEYEYDNIDLAYSFKTNYMPRICHLAKRSGVVAEVVSEMEYKLALEVGYSPSAIIFNGPIKTRSMLSRALNDGAVVHFDSFEEISYLEDLLAKKNNNKKLRCAVRCNFALQGEEQSRFGINAEDSDIDEAYERLFSLPGCDPVGIHCHYSSSVRSLESYAERTNKLLRTAKRVFSGHHCEYVDVGGGFFGKMPEVLLKQFPCKVPSYEEYAEVVGSLMKEYYPNQEVRLILEPGTMVVADTMKFYCQVSHIKHIGEQPLIICHGSIHNIKPTGKSNIFPSMHVVPSGDGKRIDLTGADICGYTCIEEDVLASGFSGSIAPGDFLIFDNVGSYSTMYKPPFIKGQSTILSMKEDGFEVIKREESFGDIFDTYAF